MPGFIAKYIFFSVLMMMGLCNRVVGQDLTWEEMGDQVDTFILDHLYYLQLGTGVFKNGNN